MILKYFIFSICHTYIGRLHHIFHHYNILETSVHFQYQNRFERDSWHTLSNWPQDVICHVKQLFDAVWCSHYKSAVDISTIFFSTISLNTLPEWFEVAHWSSRIGIIYNHYVFTTSNLYQPYSGSFFQSGHTQNFLVQYLH